MIKHLTWDEYFMAVSILSSLRSKDPSTRVGACIVKDNKIIGLGYNGLPYGLNDSSFAWENKNKASNDNKYLYVVHAEMNAILNSTRELKDSTIYVSLFPCNECAKAIVQSGIKEVVYQEDKYANTIEVQASKIIFESAGVKLRQIQASRVSQISKLLQFESN